MNKQTVTKDKQNRQLVIKRVFYAPKSGSGWITPKKIKQLIKFTAQDSFCDEKGIKNSQMPFFTLASGIFRPGQRYYCHYHAAFTDEQALARIIAMGSRRASPNSSIVLMNFSTYKD